MNAAVESVKAGLSKAWLDVAVAAALLRLNPGTEFIDPDVVPTLYRRLAIAAQARVAERTIGDVVTTKDDILQIVPQGTRLEVEATILNKDVGIVVECQEVEKMTDTFPFTRYGLVAGTVGNIWRDAIPNERPGLVYKAEISLLDTRVPVGKRWEPPVPGMTVQAEDKTGARRAITFFLSRFLRYRDERMRERWGIYARRSMI